MRLLRAGLLVQRVLVTADSPPWDLPFREKKVVRFPHIFLRHAAYVLEARDLVAYHFHASYHLHFRFVDPFPAPVFPRLQKRVPDLMERALALSALIVVPGGLSVLVSVQA